MNWFWKIYSYIADFFQNVAKSFNSKEEGYSAKKLTAAWVVIVICTPITYKFTSKENLEYTLVTWLTFAAACFGLSFYEKKQAKHTETVKPTTDAPTS